MDIACAPAACPLRAAWPRVAVTITYLGSEDAG